MREARGNQLHARETHYRRAPARASTTVARSVARAKWHGLLNSTACASVETIPGVCYFFGEGLLRMWRGVR